MYVLRKEYYKEKPKEDSRRQKICKLSFKVPKWKDDPRTVGDRSWNHVLYQENIDVCCDIFLQSLENYSFSSDISDVGRIELVESEDISCADGSIIDDSDEDPLWEPVESNQSSSSTSGRRIHFIQSSDSDESDVDTDQSRVRNRPVGRLSKGSKGKARGRSRDVRVGNALVPDMSVEEIDDWNEIDEGDDMSYLL
ncbi:hypothetical protein J6590_014058 [Homalodisca vitripennis]|nr:hypothetical protein J6590_014058 [Homalodisca vitripennis]